MERDTVSIRVVRSRELAAQYLPSNTESTPIVRLAERYLTQAKYKAMRSCIVADGEGARCRAGAGEGCLLRRIDEGGRGASEDGGNGRTRKEHAALNELGRDEWCAEGKGPS